MPKRSDIVRDCSDSHLFLWILETPEECPTIEALVDTVREALTLRHDGQLPAEVAAMLKEPKKVHPKEAATASQMEPLPSSQSSNRTVRPPCSASAVRTPAVSSAKARRTRQAVVARQVARDGVDCIQPLPRSVCEYILEVDGDLEVALLLHIFKHERRRRQEGFVWAHARQLVQEAQLFGCRTAPSASSEALSLAEFPAKGQALRSQPDGIAGESALAAFKCPAGLGTGAPAESQTASSTGHKRAFHNWPWAVEDASCESSAERPSFRSKRRRVRCSLSSSCRVKQKASARHQQGVPELDPELRTTLCEEMSQIADHLLRQVALLNRSNYIDFHLALHPAAPPNRVKTMDDSINRQIANCLVKLPPACFLHSLGRDIREGVSGREHEEAHVLSG